MIDGMYDFHKYENMLKKEDVFLNEITETCTKHGIKSAIKILKLSGLSITFLKPKKYELLFKKVYDILYGFISEDEDHLLLEKLLEDKRKIETLYNNVIKLRENKFKELFSDNIDDYEKTTYLINLELTIRSLNTMIDRNKLFNKNGRFSYMQNQMDLYNNILQNSGKIINFFEYTERETNKYELIKISKKFKENDLRMAKEHIKLNKIWSEIDYIHDYWKYGDLNIFFNEQQQFKFDFVDEELDLKICVSERRHDSFDFNEQMNVLNYLKFSEEPSKKILFQEINRNYFESFFINSSKAYSKEISISKWLEAYELLQAQCKRKIKKGYTQLSLSNTLLVKKKNDWINFFTKNGFSYKESSIIIDQFTFNSKSTDFIDYPFLELGNYLAIIPSIVISSTAGKAISYNFLNERVQLDFRGHEFESYIINELKKSNITGNGLYYKHSGAEYECDIAFCLDQDIYLIECKAHVQPFTLRHHINHLNKIEDYVKQLDRIADFYIEHPEHIKKQLFLSEDFSINNIYKIVLTTSMQGSNEKYNNTFVIDSSSFVSMLQRKSPSLKLSGSQQTIQYISEGYSCYEGDINSEKMLTYLNCPPQIHITKKFFEKTEATSELGKFTKYQSKVDILGYSESITPPRKYLEMLKS